MASIVDGDGPVRSRHYRPVEKPHPLVFLHGGMWLLGDLPGVRIGELLELIELHYAVICPSPRSR